MQIQPIIPNNFKHSNKILIECKEIPSANANITNIPSFVDAKSLVNINFRGNKELYESVSEDKLDLKTLVNEIENGADVNYMPYNGVTLLTKIVKCSHKDKYKALEYLLTLDNLDINKRQERNRQVTLMYAIDCKDNKALKMLLDHPDTDVNIVDRDNNNSLYHAYYNNNFEAYEMLLKREDTDVNMPLGYGEPLLLRVYSNTKYLEKLLENPNVDVNWDRDDMTLLIELTWSCRGSWVLDSAKTFLKHPDIDTNKYFRYFEEHGYSCNEYKPYIDSLVRNYRRGTDKRNNVITLEPRPRNIKDMVNFELWTAKEKEQLNDLIDKKDYKKIMTLLTVKGETLSKEYKEFGKIKADIRAHVEKAIRKAATETIRQEEQDLARKGLEQERIKMETKLTKREQELAIAETAVKEKDANLDKTLENKTSQIRQEERENAKKELESQRIKVENKLKAREETLAKNEGQYQKRMQELEQKENKVAELQAKAEEQNTTLDNMIKNYQTLVAEDVINTRKVLANGYRVLYDAEIDELPENMDYDDQVMYVLKVLVDGEDKLKDTDEHMPDNITKAIQDDSGNISFDGLKFLERALKASKEKFSEKDLLDSIKCVKGNYGLFDMKKTALFITNIAWKGNSIRNVIQKVEKYGLKA